MDDRVYSKHAFWIASKNFEAFSPSCPSIGLLDLFKDPLCKIEGDADNNKKQNKNTKKKTQNTDSLKFRVVSVQLLSELIKESTVIQVLED